MNTNIEHKVMAGVSAIYAGRRLSSKRALKAYVLFACALGIAAFTSLPHVMSNFLHIMSLGLPAVMTFLLTAVEKTTLGVQIALILGVLVALSLLKDAFTQRQTHFA